MSELNMDLSSPVIRKLGWEILISQLGIARSLKFMLEYNRGEGDYTKARKDMFQKFKIKDLIEDMKKEGYI